MIRRSLVGFTGAVVLLGAAALVHRTTGDGAAIGTDDRARDEVHRMAPRFQPWSESFWTPRSKRQESLLFLGQATFGFLVLGLSVHRLRRSP